MTAATRKALTLLAPLAASATLLAACGGSSGGYAPAASGTASSSSSRSAATVKSVFASSLHTTVLADAAGMTLYRLTAEGSGKFICTTSACLRIWHPLTVHAGTKPSGGLAALGTVKRPDGTTQVALNGEPLYTFAQDAKPGEASGQGIKDVGTWMAATTGGSAAAPTPSRTTSSPPPSETSSSEGESSSGGGYR